MLNRNVTIVSLTMLLALFLLVGFPGRSNTAASSEPPTEPSEMRPSSPLGKVVSASQTATAAKSQPNQLALNVERRGHTATTLADGRVIIVGGDNQNGVVSEAEMLDVSTRSIAVVGRSITARTRHSATLLNDGRVLVAGGANPAGALDSIEIFDPKTNTFVSGPSLKRARIGHTATLLEDGKVLIAGGHADRSIEIYDPAINDTTLLEAITSEPRQGHSAALLTDGNVLLAGGEGVGGHNLESAEVFNSRTSTVTATPNTMMIRRSHPDLRILPDGKVQVIGGDNDGTMEIYDPATGRFSAAVHLVPTADLFAESQMLSAQTRDGFIDSVGYGDLKIKRRNSEQVEQRVSSFKESTWRSQYAVAEIPEQGAAVIVGGSDSDQNPMRSVLLVKGSSATVTTDYVEYRSGKAPVISGSGWQPFEKVVIVRQEGRLPHKRTTLQIVANSRGKFTSTQLTSADYQPWVNYSLTARGAISGQTAQTAYYDAPPPGKEKETFPSGVKFEIPITRRDASMETEGGLLRWKVKYPQPEPSKSAVACTPVAGADFDINSSFPGVVNQQCLGIPGNPCGSSGIKLTEACFDFSGNFIVDGCFLGIGGCGGTFLKLGLDQKFTTHAVFDLSLQGSLNFEQDLFAIPGVGISFDFAKVLTGEAGVVVKAKLEVNLTTPTKLQPSFDLTEGYEIGFDSRANPAFYKTEKTPGSASGNINLTELGEGDAKLKIGPTLGFSLVAFKDTSAEIDVGSAEFGVFPFVQAIVKPTQATGPCIAGTVDLKAGVDVDAGFDVGGVLDDDVSVTLFDVGIPGFPKTFHFGTDSTAPTITNLFNIITSTNPGSCTAVATYNPTYADDCSGIDDSTIIVSPASGSSFPKGVTTVNISVKDQVGNTGTASFTVTVLDQTAPTLSVPGNITQGTDAAQCSAVVNYVASASDLCDGAITPTCSPAAGSVFVKGTTTVTCSATDSSNNGTGPKTFTVTVNDTTKPTLNLPANLTKGTDNNQCSAAVSYTAAASDNCDSGLTPSCSPASGSTFPKGTTTVNCSVTDSSSNTSTSSFTVTVNDTQKPTVTTPSGITQPTVTNTCSAPVSFSTSATDNCDGSRPVTCTPSSGSTFAKGVTTVTCTSTDLSTNQGSATFLVTVVDQQKPVISCSSNITVPTVLNTCAAPVTFNTTASDNCAVQSIVCVPPSGTTFPKGTSTVNCTATDTSANTSSCSFTVTVNDTQPPVISCPASVTGVTPRPGDTTSIVNFQSTATDNCAVASVVCVPPSGSSFPLGITSVSCTATDTSANTASCSFNVTVFDVCIQDDASPGTVLLYNSVTGDYRFCCGGTSYTGKGASTRKGSIFTLAHNTVDRRVQATVDSSVNRGNASIQSPAGTIRGTIADRDIRNNSCVCGG